MPEIVRRVRCSLRLSQEEFSRLLSATKGAVQHWERGRNKPDWARLLRMRQLLPAGPERWELDRLVRAAPPKAKALLTTFRARKSRVLLMPRSSGESRSMAAIAALRGEQRALGRRVQRLERALTRARTQLRELVLTARRLDSRFAKGLRLNLARRRGKP